jgi:hypothetical protein
MQIHVSPTSDFLGDTQWSQQAASRTDASQLQHDDFITPAVICVVQASSYAGDVRRIGVLLAVTLLLSTCSSSQEDVSVTPTCDLNLLEQLDVTTGEGSPEVRRELNRLFMMVMCGFVNLQKAVMIEREEIATALAKAKTTSSQKRSLFLACIEGAGMSEDTWRRLYLLTEKRPCNWEYNADWEASSSELELRKKEPRPWTEHAAWLKATRQAVAFARVHPDSVKPEQLTFIMEVATTVEDCLENESWCYEG